MIIISSCFCLTAFASDILPDRAYVTERTSKTYTEVIPAWTGKWDSYSSFPIQVTVTSNITYNYATGKISSYSTPSISMSCSTPERLVNTIAGAPSCSISADGYNLLVTHQSMAHTGYLWYNVAGVSAYEYTYHSLPTRTVTLSPQ